MARPRAFDEEQALKAALFAFWQFGYEGASMAVLMEATGLGKTSLYRTFGSKEQLFDRALRLYGESYLAFRWDALGESTPRRIAESLLLGMAHHHTRPDAPSGCLETNAVLVCGLEHEDMRQALVRNRDGFVEQLSARLEEAASVGPLPPGLDAKTTARLIATVIQGMAVQAKGGHSRADLVDVAQSVLGLWR